MFGFKNVVVVLTLEAQHSFVDVLDSTRCDFSHIVTYMLQHTKAGYNIMWKIT